MKGKNLFIQFLVGLVMFAVGLFWLFQRVQVSMGFGGFYIGGFNVTGGLVLVPFIAGVFWIFVNTESVGAKILTALGLILIIANIVLNIHFTMYHVSLYEFLVMLVLIAGGLGLIVKTLFSDQGKYTKTRKETVDEELEKAKKSK